MATTTTTAGGVELLDLEPSVDDLSSEAVAALKRRPRQLPCKFFYDRRGSALFERICSLPEYYPTRTEIGILRRHAGQIARLIGPGALLVEFGSGAGVKTRILLDRLDDPAAYVPIDISRAALLQSAQALAARYPAIPIRPVCADDLQPLRLPEPPGCVEQVVAFFPGSTIGNFHPDEARSFLERIAAMVGPGGALLIGVDLRKDADTLIAAYDDAAGVTAQFNLNLLARLNREAGADFRLDGFRHRAVWNARAGRVEMHLVSTARQTVHLAGETFAFEPGETIWTESSYKHTLDGFLDLARPFLPRRLWLDDAGLFSVLLLQVA